MMASKPVNVAVIGVGTLGRHHARLYKECGSACLVGIYDLDAARARTVAEEIGAAAFEQMNDLVDAVDAVSVAVPTDLHFEVVKRLLEQGKHVLVEKPITATVLQGEQLVELAERKQVLLGVGHVERYNPVLDCLDKAPGDPLFIEAHRLAAYPPPRPGLRPRGTEVSVVLDLMIHDIDVVLDLVRRPVTQIDAVGVPVLSDSEDIANARIVFENGCVANLTASRVSLEPLRKIRVFKSHAYLSLDYHQRTGEIAYRNDGAIVREPVPVLESNALKDQLEDFCRAVRDVMGGQAQARPRVTGHHGLDALRVADRILKSIAAQFKQHFPNGGAGATA